MKESGISGADYGKMKAEALAEKTKVEIPEHLSKKEPELNPEDVLARYIEERKRDLIAAAGVGAKFIEMPIKDIASVIDWLEELQERRAKEVKRMAKEDFNVWAKEMREAALSFDVSKFRAFYEKWRVRGYYEMPLPSNRVIEVSMRKMVCNLKDAPKDKVKEARMWLKTNGYTEDVR